MTSLLDLLAGMFSSSPDESVPAQRLSSVVGRLRGDGRFESDVVGESHYQDALEHICGGRTPNGHNKKVVAVLVLEDDNPHDDQAVRIDIEGRTVGYLGRALAREYRQLLTDKGHGGATLAVDAIIKGGWERGDGDMGHLGVKLDIESE